MAQISALDAIVLGIVEGFSEFLPISSTGHLILTSHLLGLDAKPEIKAGIDAFNIVIQSGALLAVFGIYWGHVKTITQGILKKNSQGQTLALNLLTAFLPAVFVGLSLGSWIKARLFGPMPVIIALFIGGVFMIILEQLRRKKYLSRLQNPLTIHELTLRNAFVIGIFQCIAMWPGTSRSMITMVAALLIGCSPVAAAEFSFLLALPTLGAATAYDFLKHGKDILTVAGSSGLCLGFAFSFLVAWVSVKGFISFIARFGMSAFGWYRIAIAIIMFILLTNPF